MNTFIEVPFFLLAVLVLGLCAALSWAWVECCIICHLTRNTDIPVCDPEPKAKASTALTPLSRETLRKIIR